METSSPPLKLRDYQLEAVEALWNALYTGDSALCVMPTGVGKTEVMIELLRKSVDKKPDIKAAILVNKIGLVEQTARRFSKHLPTGVFCGSLKRRELTESITVASIQSIFSANLECVNLIVLDEVHNVNQDAGRYISFIDVLKKKNDKLKVIAFTATPYRASGPIYGKGKLFPNITYQKDLAEMIERGFLVTPRMKRVNEQFDVSKLHVRAGEFMAEEIEALTLDADKVRAQITDALSRLEDRKKVVWACSSIAHCELVHSMLTDAGILHSKMSTEDRDRNQMEFEHGRFKHLVFVSIVSEGYDYPPIDSVVLMRPMRSPVLYVQTIGRGLRPAPDKTDLLVLDYGKVVETIGPLDNPRVSGGPGRPAKAVENTHMFCPSCLEYIFKSVTNCPACDAPIREDRNPIKSLTNRAAEESELLRAKDKIRSADVKDVTVRKYVSKNNNTCLKITYYPSSFAMSPISEFFVWNNEWALSRALNRLSELGFDILEKKAHMDAYIGSAPRIPKEVFFKLDKYPRVVRLSFDSDGS